MDTEEKQTVEPTHVHTVRLPYSLREALRTLARKHHRSLHGEILQALQEYVDRQQKEEKRD